MKSLKVGIFALIAMAGLAFMSSKISNKGGFWVPYRTHVTYLKDADGIFERSKIRVAGINAGYIEKIELEGSRAKVIFKVKDEVVVTERTTLELKTVGFLGEKFLDLVATGATGERLADGEFVKTNEAQGIEQLTETAGESLGDVKVILGKLREAIDNKETNNALKDIVLNMKEALVSVNNIASQNSVALGKMITNMERITTGLAEQFNKSNSGALINKTDDISKIIDNLRDATENLNGVVGSVNRGEGTIGKALKDDSIHESVSDTLTNVNRLVKKINTIEADISMYRSQNLTLNEESIDFNIDLYPAPERFYRFGVSQNNYGPDGGNTKIRSSTVNNVTTIEEFRETDKYPYKLNLQFARIFHRFVFRIGLIESTGGFGFDYLLSDFLGSQFTLESFDFNNEDVMNLRLAYNFRIWNVLYGRVSAENILSDSRSYTVGAGLKFTDEDLSSLLGLAARAI